MRDSTGCTWFIDPDDEALHRWDGDDCPLAASAPVACLLRRGDCGMPKHIVRKRRRSVQPSRGAGGARGCSRVRGGRGRGSATTSRRLKSPKRSGSVVGRGRGRRIPAAAAQYAQTRRREAVTRAAVRSTRRNAAAITLVDTGESERRQRERGRGRGRGRAGARSATASANIARASKRPDKRARECTHNVEKSAPDLSRTVAQEAGCSQRSQRRNIDDGVFILGWRYKAPPVSPQVLLEAQVTIAQWQQLPRQRLRDELVRRHPTWAHERYLQSMLYRVGFGGHVGEDAHPEEY